LAEALKIFPQRFRNQYFTKKVIRTSGRKASGPERDCFEKRRFCEMKPPFFCNRRISTNRKLAAKKFLNPAEKRLAKSGKCRHR
jgi:hypothetical protein